MAALNRAAWNEVAADWEKSVNYTITPSYWNNGRTTLYPFEPKLLGPVRGKKLLHLMCGAGEDSVSWAKLGAKVTGIDGAEKRLEFAAKRAAGAGVIISFQRADTMKLPFKASSFDRVFAARGITCWIPDLERWAKGIVRVLKPGGKFLLVDGHPLTCIFELGKNRELYARDDYFDNRPHKYGGWWIGMEKPLKRKKAESNWRICDLVNAFHRAGLALEFMEESPLNPGKKGVAGYDRPGWKGYLPHSIVLLWRKPGKGNR
jgi:SAM-dependent methyltransferase